MVTDCTVEGREIDAQSIQQLKDALAQLVDRLLKEISPIIDLIRDVYRGHGTAVVQRPSKPNAAGSNPAARSNSARPHFNGARDAQRVGCR